jgi:hypothetical protein
VVLFDALHCCIGGLRRRFNQQEDFRTALQFALPAIVAVDRDLLHAGGETVLDEARRK